MGQAVDKAGNVWETDASGQPVRFIGKLQAGPRVQKIGGPDPYKVEDQQMQREASARAAAAAERANINSEADRNLAERKFAVEQQNAVKPTEFQAKSAGFYGRMLSAEKQFNAIPNVDRDARGSFRQTLHDTFPGLEASTVNSSNRNTADQAALDFIRASLRQESGAAINKDEEIKQYRIFFPAPGDTEDQLKAKARARAQAIQGFKIAAGPLAPQIEQTIAPPIQLSPNARGTAMGTTQSEIAKGGTESIPVPDAMRAGLEGYLRGRRGSHVDNQDFAAFYNDLAKRNNYPGGTPESLNAYIKQFNETGAIGPITPAKQDIGAFQQLYNDVALTPWGTGTIRSANTLAGGIPEMLAGDQARQGLSQLAEQNPKFAFIGDTAGAIAGTAGLVKGINALGAPLSKALTVGNLGYGGIYGASQNPENPLAGAAIGAMASGAGDLAGGYVASPILEALGPKTINPALRLAGRPALPAPPSISRPESTIINTVGNQGRAVTNLLGDASALGVPMTLADTTEGLRSLGGAVARRSPEARSIARNVMEPRALGQIDRLQGAISRDFGDPANVLERSDALLNQARKNSQPLYNEAFQAPGASSVNADDILNTPAGKQALARARTQMLNDRKDPSALGIDINDAGEPVLSRVPSFETFDYVKKGFDDIANEGRTPFGTFQPNADQAAAANLSSSLRSRIDEVNPAYAQARAAYAGPASEREALQMGKAAIGQPAESIAYTLKNMPAPRQEQYRLGALSGLSERANNARFSANPFDVVAGSPEAQKRLGALFSDRAARFINQANLERQLARSNNQIIGGSPTALNHQADQALAGGLPTSATLALDAGSAMLTGAPPVATGARLLGGISKDAFKLGLGKKRADELAPILFNPDAAQAAEAFRELQKNVRRKGVFNEAKKKRRGIFGTVSGGASASAISTEKQ